MTRGAAAQRRAGELERRARLAHTAAMKGEPGLAAAIGDEQLKAVLGHTRLGTLVAAAFATFLALQLRGRAIDDELIFAWLTAKLLVAAIRITITLRHDRLGRPGGAQWRNRTDAWLAVDGVIWGIAGLLVVSAPFALAALVAAVMACVSSVATFGLQFSKRSTAAYAGPILTLTGAGLFARADEFGTVGGTGMVVLLGLQLATAMASERRLVEAVQLRLRADALTREKEQALQLALRESAAKTQFLGNVSHELRTPLHGMLGVARLLHLEARDTAVARRVELIESSGVHLLGLINDLIDVSRLGSGSFALRSERFDLAAVVTTLGEVYSVRADEKGLAFSLDLQCPRPCWVLGDPARVRQVLHNLLGNAVKFTRRGSVDLALTRDGASGCVAVEVRDSGPGIAAADLALVFKAFEQAGDAASRPLEGTGLGLTIARDLARAMGGDLALQSAPGVGTCARFSVRLPDAGVSADADGATAAQAPSIATGARVLLAEDDEVNAIIAIAYLEQLGARTEHVRDGEQAVRHALREVDRPDLVLMDCRMPALDGLAATREIRAQELTLGLPRLPVIALTATSGEVGVDQCRAAGMDDFMAKPYTQQELNRMLQRWIAGPATAAVTLG